MSSRKPRRGNVHELDRDVREYDAAEPDDAAVQELPAQHSAQEVCYRYHYGFARQPEQHDPDGQPEHHFAQPVRAVPDLQGGIQGIADSDGQAAPVLQHLHQGRDHVHAPPAPRDHQVRPLADARLPVPDAPAAAERQRRAVQPDHGRAERPGVVPGARDYVRAGSADGVHLRDQELAREGLQGPQINARPGGPRFRRWCHRGDRIPRESDGGPGSDEKFLRVRECQPVEPVGNGGFVRGW
uniref:(northern house mosquito) hypothetical protein n=1 Tax=Culex pipiens TaxID=7175 RepID=A0A8D8BHC6_CULPI